MDDVVSFESLFASKNECRKNVTWKTSTTHFDINGIKSTLKLKHELESGLYKPSPTKTFFVMSAKRREVMGVTFKDRVYQRSLCDNAVYPAIVKRLIYDNCACQKGKGTDFARDRFVCHLQRFYRKHGLDGYILQCDIKGYYPNMRHDVAEATFRRRLPSDVYAAVEAILKAQYNGDVGFFPGSQLVQIAGITVLDDLDHFIKEKLRVKHYLRYMDDFVIMHHDRKFVEWCRDKIAAELAKIGFELHPTKTQRRPISEPTKFLGFSYRLMSTGRIVKTIDSRNVKRMRRKLRRLVNKSEKGLIPREVVDDIFRCWLNHASRGNTRHVIERMHEYYSSLWGNPP